MHAVPRHCPYAEEQSNPCLRQLHLAEAQPVAQLQRIILSKDTGEVVIGHGNHLVTAKLPAPVFKLHPVTKTLPLFDL